ncbi:UNVERIFIED_CONTAM: hypothetical protein RMT77_011359 [Armadillidium vulgare]
MSQLFENLEYDLAENKIYTQKIVISLKFKALTVLVENFCRKGVITQCLFNNIEKLRNSREISDYLKIVDDLTKILLIEMNIFEPRNIYFSILNKFRTYIKESVGFIAMQICDLLKKEKIAKDEWRNVSFLMKNLSVTTEGTINLKKLIHQILTAEQLDPSHSCQLACYYFMEHEIVQKHCQMVISLNSYNFFDSHIKYEALQKCLNYWCWLILHYDDDPVRIFLKNTSNTYNDQLRKVIINTFEGAVKYNNEIAVHYLWKNYISRFEDVSEILRKALQISIPLSSHINISIFLLFQTNINERTILLKSMYFLILSNIIGNIRWQFLFFNTLNEVKIYLNVNDYIILLRYLTGIHFIDRSTTENGIIQFIYSFPNDVKEYLSKTSHDIFNPLITKPFKHAKLKLVKTLLAFRNVEDVKNYFLSICGMDLIAETIKVQNLEFIKNFIQERYTMDEVINFKKVFFKYKLENLYEYFMENLRFHNVIEVIDWLSEAVNENLPEFKKKMLSYRNGYYFKHLIFMPNVDLASVNKFLIWSFRTDESLSSFKRKINICRNKSSRVNQDVVPCYNELKTLLLKSKWNFFYTFINWKECTLPEKGAFLQKLIKDDIFISKIISQTRNSWDFFDSFINFLEAHFDLNDSKRKILNENIFRGILQQNLPISDLIRYYYENSRPAEEIHFSIQNTGIKFYDSRILNWLTSQK